MPTTVKKKRTGNFYLDRKPEEQQVAPKRKISLGKFFGRAKNLFLLLLLLAAVLALAIGIGKVFVLVYDSALTSSLFTTKSIEVSGNVRLPRELVLQYAGIAEGQNSLAVNISGVEQRLRQTPWVESVSVERLLPDRFVIKIHERMPSFWVHKDSVLYYANDAGEIIAPVESKNFLSLPTVNVEQGAEDLRIYLSKFNAAIKNSELPFDMSAISQITLSLSKGLEVFLEDREIWLSFDPTDWNTNITRIKMVFNDLIRRREMKNVREMRVIDGNVWVVLNVNATSLPSEN